MQKQAEHVARADATMPIRAAIDIGSNTIHLVIARCLPDDLEILEDELELLRIGESVNATGSIAPQKCEEAIATVRKYKALVEHYTTEPVLVVATEAIRQANNSQEFIAAMLAGTGLAVQIIDGAVEAMLTFYGATYEYKREPQSTSTLGVMDLGGGSIELVIAKQRQIDWSTSFPIGSGWLHDRYLPSDPPTHDELDIAHTFLHTYFEGLHIKQRIPLLIITGGSANTLLYLAQHAPGGNAESSRLTHDDLVRCKALLETQTAAEIAQLYSIAPARARILPAGALIIQTMMEHLGLSEIHVSAHGIREGALLARTRYGEQWLEHMQSEQWEQQGTGEKTTAPQEEQRSESFAESGRRLLLDRTMKMLEWRNDVLRNEDVEAVHKMRVASRRLRALLDAYKTACDPQQFKKVYRNVKRLADILGKARDTDVMIASLQAQREQLPPEEQAGIQWFIQRLEAYRGQHQRQLEIYLRKLDRDALQRQMRSCLPRDGAAMAKALPGLRPEAHTGEDARILARTRLEEMYSWQEHVDHPYRIHELHNLRIAAKRLRYTLEIFADALPEASALMLKEVEQIQEELGALHDSDMMIALLRLCLGSLDGGTGYEAVLAQARQLQAKGKYILNPRIVAQLLDPLAAPDAEERRGLEQLLRDLQQRREREYTAFRQHWQSLYNFRQESLTILQA